MLDLSAIHIIPSPGISDRYECIGYSRDGKEAIRTFGHTSVDDAYAVAVAMSPNAAILEPISGIFDDEFDDDCYEVVGLRV